MNPIHLQLVERVARGRLGRPDSLEQALMTMNQDPYGPAEQALDKVLTDPGVSVDDKAHFQALLQSIEGSDRPDRSPAPSGHRLPA